MRTDKAIWFLAAAQTIIWAGLYYSFPALLIKWETGLGWSKTDLTFCFTSAVAASALSSPIAGRLIDGGHGPVILAGSAFVGGLLIGSLSFVDMFALFWLVWVLIGVMMSACLYEPCFALVTRARGVDAKRSITLITLVAGFASTVSFPMAHSISVAADWRAAVLSFAAIVCFVGAPLGWFGARLLEQEKRAAPVALQDGPVIAAHGFLRHPAFWLLAIGFALMALNHGIVLNHLLPLLDERRFDPTTAVFAASMIGPMQVTGRLAMMAAEKHVSMHTITVASYVAVSSATLFLMGAGFAPALLVGYVVLQGSGYGVTSIMKPVVTREILGERNFGAITGAMAVPYLAAFAFAPTLGSLLWETGGYDLALWTAFLSTALGLMFYLIAARWRTP